MYDKITSSSGLRILIILKLQIASRRELVVSLSLCYNVKLTGIYERILKIKTLFNVQNQYLISVYF